MRASANSADSHKPEFASEAAEAFVIDRKVRIQKGSWHQMPKSLERDRPDTPGLG